MTRSGTDDSRSTVLVVDDEPDTADTYTDILGDDYEVLTVYSGEEALETITSDVAVVLLDRRMPGLSGDEVLEHIREEEYGCRIVMVTAIDPDTDIIDLPFDDYLVKPVTSNDLHDAVERMLARNSHDEQIKEMVAIASKMATLESKMDIAELEASEQYAALQSEFDQLRQEVGSVDPDDDLYAEFTTEKMRSLLGL